ncbi:hypothetical protein F2Q70_00040385 [Brassica cretica]|uniref:Uncharacterized protein n=1 Tax=Brassica cretica TaxID=69181 RepID=A0A8S9K611_BRACR|nr:hypothetical protein F2Q70_00040385 [Brassica cretica]
MRCHIGDGKAISFWYDWWTDLGPLITIFGNRGTRDLRIPLHSTVSAAAPNGSWLLLPARSNEAETLQVVLSTMQPPSDLRGKDIFLWRSGHCSFTTKFSSKATWEFMRQPAPLVPWSKLSRASLGHREKYSNSISTEDEDPAPAVGSSATVTAHAKKDQTWYVVEQPEASWSSIQHQKRPGVACSVKKPLGAACSVKKHLEGQTDPDRADILWETSSVMKLVVTVLQQCCLECLVNPTVRSSLIELKFGRGVVDWFILDLYGGISLWLPESLGNTIATFRCASCPLSPTNCALGRAGLGSPFGDRSPRGTDPA